MVSALEKTHNSNLNLSIKWQCFKNKQWYITLDKTMTPSFQLRYATFFTTNEMLNEACLVVPISVI